jgi:Rad3-related DNA helicase
LLQPSFTEKGQDLRGFISEANEAGAKDLQEKQQAFSKARSCFEEKKNSVIDLYDLTVDEIEQLPKCVSVEPGASAAQLSDAISKTYETISTLEDKASELALRRNALIQLDIPESISTLEEIDELIQKLNELKTEVKHGRKCILKAGK